MAGKKIRNRQGVVGTLRTAAVTSNVMQMGNHNNSVIGSSSSSSGGAGGSPPSNTPGGSGGGIGGGGGAGSKNMEQLLGMTKEQLKNECRKRGQKTTGNKTELLQRLGYKMAANTKRQLNIREQQIGGNSHIASSTTSSMTSSSSATNGTASIPPTTTSNDVSRISGGGSGDPSERARRERERRERESLLLWKRPLVTCEYALREIVCLLTTYGKKLLQHKSIVILGVLVVIASYVVVNSAGPHQSLVQKVYKKLLWCLYWIGLGILSSVGLGTGLHTFLLYLGPHIAAVTLAAYECASVDFPEPPYPDDIVCPPTSALNGLSGSGGSGDTLRPLAAVTMFTIMSKVRLEAMCWGAGTALGELPPYFMARAARLSGLDPDEEDEDDGIKELEELERKKSNRAELSLVEKGKLFVEELVQKVGFLGILACASIPNPLFDLAGITCGHFLVPFWTFFGATLIGKAVIKMHIQKLFVIVAFNETLLETALEWLARVPMVGARLQTPFRAYLDGQKYKLHTRGKSQGGGGGTAAANNMLASIFEKFVVAMICYFVVSIVNSFAQNYHKRIHKRAVTGGGTSKKEN